MTKAPIDPLARLAFGLLLLGILVDQGSIYVIDLVGVPELDGARMVVVIFFMVAAILVGVYAGMRILGGGRQFRGLRWVTAAYVGTIAYALLVFVPHMLRTVQGESGADSGRVDGAACAELAPVVVAFQRAESRLDRASESSTKAALTERRRELSTFVVELEELHLPDRLRADVQRVIEASRKLALAIDRAQDAAAATGTDAQAIGLTEARQAATRSVRRLASACVP